MIDSLPRNSPKMTLLDRTRAKQAVIMKDNKIYLAQLVVAHEHASLPRPFSLTPVPATPASLGVDASASLEQLAKATSDMLNSLMPR